MLTIAKKIFDEWNKKNVKYCHWKSNEHLLDGLNGVTDVDVLVSINDKVRCESILKDVGYRRFISQAGSRYTNVGEWLGFDEQTGKLIHIHLHYELITGTKHVKEYIFPWSNLALDTRIMDKKTNVCVVSPNLEIIILYTRIVLKAARNKELLISGDYFKEIAYLKQRIDSEKVKGLCSYLFNTHGEAIFNLINKEVPTKQDLISLRKIVRKELKNCKKMNKVQAFLKHKYFRYTIKMKKVLNLYFSKTFILKKMVSNNGFSVCFIGADGSGKSTLSNEIEKWLSWKIESKKFYLGSGDQYNSLFKILLKCVNKIRKQPNKSQEDGNNTDEIKEKKSKKINIVRYISIVSYSYELVRIAKNKLKTLKKINDYQKRGGIAILDRFPQMQYEGIYDGPKIVVKYQNYLGLPIIKRLARREKKILEKAIVYSPTIVFKLKLPPSVSISRKPDHDLDEIKAKAEITDNLVFERSTVYNIDATQPYQNELLEVKREIWKKISIH